jgi:hypothetical protein
VVVVAVSIDLGNNGGGRWQTTVGNNVDDDVGNNVGDGDDGGDNASDNASKGDGGDTRGERGGGLLVEDASVAAAMAAMAAMAAAAAPYCRGHFLIRSVSKQ